MNKSDYILQPITRGIKRTVVIGISGTGKSTLGRWMAERTKLPIYHMDSLQFGEDWKKTEPREIEKSLERISQTDRWIVEGWIDTYSKSIFDRADLILYLDYPGWLAMWGGLKRWWMYRGTQRPEMPAGCEEFLNPSYLKIMLHREERPHIENLLQLFKHKNVVRCSSRKEVYSYARQLEIEPVTSEFTADKGEEIQNRTIPEDQAPPVSLATEIRRKCYRQSYASALAPSCSPIPSWSRNTYKLK